MILADTSIWIDHLRENNPRLEEYLAVGGVLMHPFVLGELLMGNLSPRVRIIKILKGIEQTAVARHDEVLNFVETHKLLGTGIGYIDAHVLVTAHLLPDTTLWTRDKRLESAAARFGLSQ